MMRKLLTAGLCLAALSLSHAAQAQKRGTDKSGATAPPSEGNEIALSVGETHTLSARDVKNYSEGVSGIIDVKLTSDASQFVLVGRKPGSTTLLLIRNDGSQVVYTVNVFTRSPAVVEKELSDLLANLNVQSRRVGAQIVLDGVVNSEAELQRVKQIANLYPNQVTSLVQLAQPGMAAVVSTRQRFLIRIDFYFVQYDKNSSYNVGLGWPDAFAPTAELQYDFLLNSVRAAAASITGQVLPRLDLATRHGWAKVIKQATVITNNGTEASFSNGGEQNFPVNTGLTIGVQKIPFGTELNVMANYDPDQRELALRVNADVSDLTASVSGTQLPGRTTSHLTTNVALKLGQSLVLSGIRTQSLTHSVKGLPGLSEIPVLGILFGTHSNDELQTEGAIFVVPSIVQTVPTAAAELVDLAMKKFKDYDGGIDHVKAYDARPGGGVDIPR